MTQIASIKDIPTIIRRTIDERGMTIATVARRAGMQPNALSASLCGRRRLKAIELIQLCRVLEIFPGLFIERSRS